MGNKLSCVPCKKAGRRRRRKNKILPQTTLNNKRQETRASSVILRELQELGFVQEAAKVGGVTFVVDADTNDTTDVDRRPPRRLPALLSKLNKANADEMPEDAFYTKDEKSLIADIMANEDKDEAANTIEERNERVENRRKSLLNDKGKMARKSEERRKEVLERREAKRKERIVKTKERLEKERLDIQTIDSKPKRLSYEERRSKLLEKRKQLLLERKAKTEEKVEDMETTQNTITEPVQDGLPAVFT